MITGGHFKEEHVASIHSISIAASTTITSTSTATTTTTQCSLLAPLISLSLAFSKFKMPFFNAKSWTLPSTDSPKSRSIWGLFRVDQMVILTYTDLSYIFSSYSHIKSFSMHTCLNTTTTPLRPKSIEKQTLVSRHPNCMQKTSLALSYVSFISTCTVLHLLTDLTQGGLGRDGHGKHPEGGQDFHFGYMVLTGKQLRYPQDQMIQIWMHFMTDCASRTLVESLKKRPKVKALKTDRPGQTSKFWLKGSSQVKRWMPFGRCKGHARWLDETLNCVNHSNERCGLKVFSRPIKKHHAAFNWVGTYVQNRIPVSAFPSPLSPLASRFF